MAEQSAIQQQLLETFDRDGYVVLPEKIPDHIIDPINDAYNDAANRRSEFLLRLGGKYSHPGPLGIVARRKRIIDFYVPCPAALDATLAKPITDFLSAIYHEAPLAFQSLLFQFGSRQNPHQDTAYVVTSQPEKLTASWIALEDIQPGSGELYYYEGSHKGIQVNFAGGKQVWARQTDSVEDNEEYAGNLQAACEAAGLTKKIFQARKGEILIWHANLVHGGSPITDESLTRRSLVTHYCPVSADPNYFRIQPASSVKRAYAGGFYSSRHYDVRPESNNPYPIYTGNPPADPVR